MGIAEKNNQDGFTLVELIVALSLFIIVITIALGGFVRALRTEREITNLISANNNAVLVLEQMSREIRTGSNFCDGIITNCDSAGQLQFLNANGCMVLYNFNTINGSLERSDDCQGGGLKTLTAGNIQVKYLNFMLLGNKPNDNYPPRITIVIGVNPKNPELQGDITSLQTTVSARQIDS